MTAPAIARLLEGRFLETVEIDDQEVAGLWARALESYRDSEAPRLSRTGAFKQLYDAGRQAVTALVAAHGFRARGTAGHHQSTFAAGAALAPEELARLIRRLELSRGVRHELEYSAFGEASVEEVEELRELVRSTINETASQLRALRPAVRQRIGKLQ